jgi:hypothetical protein
MIVWRSACVPILPERAGDSAQVGIIVFDDDILVYSIASAPNGLDRAAARTLAEDRASSASRIDDISHPHVVLIVGCIDSGAKDEAPATG